ncbi:M24 family metallopeptidase [Solicola gregarius]|uniref:Xaa-Pro peptidase family protein n=1 Tax=Solicola gregarius TaxID=2908642 RepID=A0AA46TGX5_9ACTN|nr:Xaa-Pro peptidase family protein [Solicola gregarius]UYM05065.1 Xaa-Pro peptidase family protein [Solicola gregarius]
MTSDLRGRLLRAGEVAAERGIDTLLVSPGSDLRYLTGYDAKPLERLTCLVLPTDRPPALVVPLLERHVAEASGVADLGIEIVTWEETDDPYALVAAHIGSHAPTIAYDNQMWAEKVLAFADAIPGAKQTLAGEVIGALRMRKSDAEIDLLREAGAAIDRVHARIGEWLRPGRTEREVGADIAAAIIDEGHATVDFVIVGSGPNGASPHHEVSDRVIEANEPVVIDIGGTTAAGYCSDSTRTYVTGAQAPPDFRDYYAVLLEAQRAQCEYVRPGVTAASVDKVGRDIIAAAGYGDAFIHRTGHGIGMETHEDPYIVDGNGLVLEAGMAFSIEPGIYLAGTHGARIEDIVICTPDGSERLNRRPRDVGYLS